MSHAFTDPVFNFEVSVKCMYFSLIFEWIFFIYVLTGNGKYIYTIFFSLYLFY